LLRDRVDREADGQPGPGATGDDELGIADEDGVAFTSGLFPGGTATVSVYASTAARLDAWVDFNANGVFDQPQEQVFASRSLAAGDNILDYHGLNLRDDTHAWYLQQALGRLPSQAKQEKWQAQVEGNLAGVGGFSGRSAFALQKPDKEADRRLRHIAFEGTQS